MIATKVEPMRKSTLFKAVAAACTTIMCLGFAACGSSNAKSDSSSDSSSSSSNSSSKMNQIAGVTATGKPGKKPTVSFKTPMTVEDNSYVAVSYTHLRAHET